MVALSALSLVVTGIVAGAGSVAKASAEASCHGQTATIVGDPSVRELHGTEGPDVIVTNGSLKVFAGAGDDVICTMGTTLVRTSRPWVEAGAGDDVVDTSAELPNVRPYALLGTGDDSYVGGRLTTTWMPRMSGTTWSRPGTGATTSRPDHTPDPTATRSIWVSPTTGCM